MDFFFFVSCLWSRWCHPPPGHPRPLSASLKPSLPPGEPGEHARHPEHLPGHGHGGGRGGGVERAALHRQESLQSTRGETLRPPTPSWVGHSLAGWAWAFLGCSLKGSSSVLWASDQCPCDIPSFWGALPHPGTHHLPCPAPSQDKSRFPSTRASITSLLRLLRSTTGFTLHSPQSQPTFLIARPRRNSIPADRGEQFVPCVCRAATSPSPQQGQSSGLLRLET